MARMLGTTAALGGDVTRERILRALRTAGAVHVAEHGHLSTADGFASVSTSRAVTRCSRAIYWDGGAPPSSPC